VVVVGVAVAVETDIGSSWVRKERKWKIGVVEGNTEVGERIDV